MKVLLTGSSRGIGFEIAKEMLASGHTIILHCNKNADRLIKLKEQYNDTCHVAIADLSKIDGVQDLINITKKLIKFPDTIINNAGIVESSLINKNLDEWSKLFDRTIHVNLRTPSLLCKEFIMLKRENKIKSKLRVINISSRAAFRGEEEDFISYACSKGGLISLTKTHARSFGKKDKVIPFSIAPGFVNTEMAKSFIEQHGEGLASKGIVLDKLTEPKDIAPLVNFIVSGKMDHAVGSTIDINAGSYLR